VRISRLDSLRYYLDEKLVVMKLNFSIDSWSAWSSVRGGVESWSSSRAFEMTGRELTLPNLSLIPAMKQRRMSFLSKMAVSTALDCLARYNGEKPEELSPKSVFASSHGELSRSIKIIESMVSSGEISPTDFSLSVHNTALGLFSILTRNCEAATSIAAGNLSFGYGLLEACMQLGEGKQDKVLLVYFDEPLPKMLIEFERENPQSICIALLLSKDTESKQKFSFASNVSSKNGAVEASTIDLGERFLDFYLSGKAELNIRLKPKSEKCWQWVRQC